MSHPRYQYVAGEARKIAFTFEICSVCALRRRARGVPGNPSPHRSAGNSIAGPGSCAIPLSVRPATPLPGRGLAQFHCAFGRQLHCRARVPRNSIARSAGNSIAGSGSRAIPLRVRPATPLPGRGLAQFHCAFGRQLHCRAGVLRNSIARSAGNSIAGRGSRAIPLRSLPCLRVSQRLRDSGVPTPV